VNRNAFGAGFEPLEDRLVPANPPAVFNVNTNADTALAKVAQVNGFDDPEDANGNTSLRAVIQYCNQNVLVGNFAAGKAYQVNLNGIDGQTISLNGAMPALKSNFNFYDNSNGPGVTLDAQNNSNIFIINAGTESHFQNVSFANGLSGMDGGAILNNGTLQLLNCNFWNNRANRYGGAIASGSGSVLVTNYCGFWLNTAGSGGAIAAISTQHLDIVGGDIFSNSALAVGGQAGFGGGVYVFGSANPNDVPLIEQNTNIYGNSAGGAGGGVYVAATDLTMSGGQIYSNDVTGNGNGGGLYVNGVDATGQTYTVTLTNVAVTANQAGGQGGGAYVNNGELGGQLTALSGNQDATGVNGNTAGIAFNATNNATAPIALPPGKPAGTQTIVSVKAVAN